jgi:glycosyltransferase involved in cell wall biosynthesis
MTTVAYLANQFPSAVEPYVGEEIKELRRRGVRVIAGSVRSPDASVGTEQISEGEFLCLAPLRAITLMQSLWWMARSWRRVAPFLKRALVDGREPYSRRFKALLHTWLGAYYAVRLRGREVDQIHVHHGYFGSWVGMVAASLLQVGFSFTLHGSDLLIHHAFLEEKLARCRFCITISDYNRSYILKRFPKVEASRVVVSRLGAKVRASSTRPMRRLGGESQFSLLAVGRLHAVKNHPFLIEACWQLREAGLEFECAIAGAGPEQLNLERLIEREGLQDRVRLLGQRSPRQIEVLYRGADLFVVTSLSEGIPLVLMEAMACETIVLAPAITGIPELVIPGKTGFLYKPGDMRDFVRRISFLRTIMISSKHPSTNRLHWIRHAGRAQVRHNFDGTRNLAGFGDRFLRLLEDRGESCPA